MTDVADFIGKAHEIYGYDHFLNDAGGSLCELDDPGVMKVLSDHTLILYLRAGEDMEQELINRAIRNPKPLYYREDFLDREMQAYLQETGETVCPMRSTRTTTCAGYSRGSCSTAAHATRPSPGSLATRWTPAPFPAFATNRIS